MYTKRELWYNIIEVIIMIHENLKYAFEQNNGVLTPEMALNYGIHDSTLRKAVERNDIQKYCRGVYFLEDLYYDDLYFMQLKYPKGVYSHETAVMLHTLSTYSPFYFHISFPENYRLGSDKAKEQYIRTYYTPEIERTDEYIEVMDSWDSNPIRVTNLEKTVVDMLRKKVPMPGIVDEMINDYIDRDDTNIQKLVEYGTRFDVINQIEERILPYVKSTKNEKSSRKKI